MGSVFGAFGGGKPAMLPNPGAEAVTRVRTF